MTDRQRGRDCEQLDLLAEAAKAPKRKRRPRSAQYHERAHARRTDPETSHAAAATVKVSPRRLEAMLALQALGPTTSDRVANYLGQNLTVVSPRFRPLADLGMVEETGEFRPTTVGGKDAIVWALTERGREYLAARRRI